MRDVVIFTAGIKHVALKHLRSWFSKPVFEHPPALPVLLIRRLPFLNMNDLAHLMKHTRRKMATIHLNQYCRLEHGNREQIIV
jgi:hypothetical protein